MYFFFLCYIVYLFFLLLLVFLARQRVFLVQINKYIKPAPRSDKLYLRAAISRDRDDPQRFVKRLRSTHTALLEIRAQGSDAASSARNPGLLCSRYSTPRGKISRGRETRKGGKVCVREVSRRSVTKEMKICRGHTYPCVREEELIGSTEISAGHRRLQLLGAGVSTKLKRR